MSNSVSVVFYVRDILFTSYIGFIRQVRNSQKSNYRYFSKEIFGQNILRWYYTIIWFITDNSLLFNVLQKCTLIHVLIVHFCYAKMYIFVVQKCTLLQDRRRLLKNNVNCVNTIAGAGLIRNLLDWCALCVQSGAHCVQNNSCMLYIGELYLMCLL